MSRHLVSRNVFVFPRLYILRMLLSCFFVHKTVMNSSKMNNRCTVVINHCPCEGEGEAKHIYVVVCIWILYNACHCTNNH